MHRPNAPIATFPGFRLLPEGGSRVYVELTHAVTVEQHQSGTNLSFTLKGAEVLAENNKNALVTTHFSTPMNRARLVPVKGDVELVIELRKPVNVTPAGGARRKRRRTPRSRFSRRRFSGRYCPAVRAIVAFFAPFALRKKGAPRIAAPKRPRRMSTRFLRALLHLRTRVPHRLLEICAGSCETCAE